MQIISATFPAMGTQCEVVLVASQEENAKKAIALVAEEVARIESKFSRYRNDSITSFINRGAGSGQPTEIDTETAWLLSFAHAVYESSHGLFDLTTGVVSRAWDFQKKEIPTQERLSELLAYVGWDKVNLTEHTVYLPIKGMEIDFGGIGKEYAVDSAVRLLKKIGFTHGYLNFGGDVGIVGGQPDGAPWNIGVRNPNKADGIIAMMPLTAGALTTSGDYERFFEINGSRYTHIIHPRTGYPVNFSSSVSVVADAAIYAGCCSTVAMLMQEPESFLAQYDIKYLIIKSDESIKRG